MLFDADEAKPGTSGNVTLWVDDRVIGEGKMAHTVPVAFSSYAGMDVGRDNGLVVDLDYEDKAPYAFTGTVKRGGVRPQAGHPRGREGAARARAGARRRRGSGGLMARADGKAPGMDEPAAVSVTGDRGGPLIPRSAPRAFHLLAKPTGAVCNLDCTYCFFLSKEMLYPGSRFRMADDLLDSYLRQLIEAHAGAPEVVVAWQGGEPTMMGLDFFRRSVELAERYRQPGQRIVYTIQTNGTLLDDEWGAFFAEHGFLVGLSIDGPRRCTTPTASTRAASPPSTG